MKKLLITAAASLLLLNGCATVFGPSQDTITVSTQDNDTKVFVDGLYMGNGTVTYPVPRGKSVTLSAEKKGCSPRVLQTGKSVVGLTFINILFWPGFIVDAATGSIMKADPVFYNLRLNCDS
ncbi:putative periplasmic lipoprotein [Zymobacter palmae]|uniref:hypothetical protein n=1 Tax=Zymobacter palmae TaxID=33074 RepID=UPI0011AE68D6|nr:hypothetical protein [Zymobacter palmae]